MAVDKAGRYHEDNVLHLLHPEEHVLTEMLSGWRNQQLSRNLQISTIEAREAFIRRFVDASNQYPWAWTVANVDEFFGDLRSIKHAANSTVRGYQNALRMFCDYITSADYGWPELCERLFGTHPIQVCFAWNTATHVQGERVPTDETSVHPARTADVL